MTVNVLSFHEVTPLALTAASEAGVPPSLVMAIARHESAGFRPDARRGEPHLGDSSHGLMQILLSTARAAGYTGPVGAWNVATRSGTGLYDPLTNLRYGARHLKGLLLSTNGDVERAVSAYNAGLGNAKKATVQTRFCSVWKSTAPKTGRNLDRDCAKIRTVRPGEWMNQDYVNTIMELRRQYAQLDTAGLPVGNGDGSRPAGGLPSGPSSSPSGPLFVVRPTVAILLAALASAAYIIFKRLG